MQRREKILLYGLVAAFVLWRGAPAAYRFLFGPVEERRSQLSGATAKFQAHKLDELELNNAIAKTKIWNAISLPPNPLDGQRLYQEWLTDTSILCGLRNVKVTPGRRASMGPTGTLVQVKVEGDATLAELSRFLDRFRRTPILHRVVQFGTESPSSQGDPRLKVTLVAEGVSLKDASERERLFPETQLAADLPESGSLVEVKDAKGLPAEAGFQLKIADEYLSVSRVDRNRWSVVRGVDGTKPKAHKSGAKVEVIPVHPEVDKLAATDVKSLLKANPFAKPAPPRQYNPRLGEIARQTIIRGTPWKMRVSTSGLDSDLGKPVFSLADGSPETMKIDEKSGEISWSPDDEVEAAEYDVTVMMSVPELEKPLSRAFKVTLREANLPPKLDRVASQKVYVGRTLAVKLKATDDGPASGLKFQLGTGAPAGCAIDEKTGELKWTPGDAVEPGEFTVPVSVSDGATPPLTATGSVTVTVLEDTAAYTFFTGSVVRDGEPEAWLYDRLNNRRLIVNPGLRFQIADIAATVREIGRETILLDAADGQWKMRLGDNLRQMQLISFASPPSASRTTEAPEPAVAELPPSAAGSTKSPRSPSPASEPATAEIPVEDTAATAETPEAP